MNKPIYVFDACALIAFLSGEDGAEKVKYLLETASADNAEIYLHRINLFEVYYDACKVGGQAKANKLYHQILKLPITVVDKLDEQLFFCAGTLKASNKISLADSIALALTSDLKAALVTSDHHEFDTIDAAGIVSFLWIR